MSLKTLELVKTYLLGLQSDLCAQLESVENPQHPFIVPDAAEDTRYSIDGVIGVVQQCILAEIDGSSTVNDHARTLTGLLTILDGVRSATEYLSYLDPVPSNVVELREGA